ncbi:MAG: transposase [Candidatus Scalindua sp.]
MRNIVKTIDIYALKKRYLHKHVKDVEVFYEKILNEDYESELAISWQKRFKRNKGKLFNFMNYDGIPWNNNNAENAIKPLAKYRARAKGILREEGVKNYLVLLSIQQTCKYRGVNFLEFLKSKEKSI